MQRKHCNERRSTTKNVLAQQDASSTVISGLTNVDDFESLDSFGIDAVTTASTNIPHEAPPPEQNESFSDSLAFRKPRASRACKSSNQKLNELTINKLRFSLLDLYGRDAEIQRLQEVYSTSETSRQLVLIDGAAGSGKTALCSQLEKLTSESIPSKGDAKRPSLFIRGKFDQQLVNEPYAGISAACRQLCEQLLYLKKERRISLSKLQLRLKSELQEDLKIVTRIVPSLLQIATIEEGDEHGKEDVDVGFKEARNRFQFAFRRFLRVMSSFLHLVFALEDLQWADSSSLNLIESLVSDQQLSHLLIVGNYRHDGVGNKHEVSEWIDKLEEASKLGTFNVTTISIHGLDVEHVNEMLLELLTAKPGTTDDLAAIVHKKTNGNPFFVVQYLRLLHDNGLLEYNLGALKWTWNLEEIQLRTTATSNVIDLIQEKLKRLPQEVIKILPMMASLGSTFQFFLFARIFLHFNRKRLGLSTGSGVVQEEEDLNALQHPGDIIHICLKEGLIEEFDADVYHWAHDKIQEASFRLITESELSSLQFQMGELLFQYLSENELADPIFVTVNLLNQGIDQLPEGDARREKFASLNLEAGKKAVASSSFVLAGNYFQNGIALLPTDPWNKVSYSLCLDLYSSAAEMCFCLGDFDQMESHCNQVLGQKMCPFLDKRRVYNALLDSLGARAQMRDAADLCVDILGKIGCKFPRRGRKLYVAAGIIQLKATLKKRTPERIAQLPLMTDESKIWAVTLICKLTGYLYYDTTGLLPLSMLHALRLTLTHGICTYSPIVCAFVGLILAGVLGDLKGGQVYGEHAFALLERVPNRITVEGATIFAANTFVLHWTHPIETCKKPLLRGYEAGMYSGEPETATWCIFMYLWYHQILGGSLLALEADIKMYAYQMREFKQMKQLSALLIMWQGVLNLLGRSNETVKLEGGAMDFLHLCTGTGGTSQDKVSQDIPYRRQQAILAFYFNEFEVLTGLIEEFGENYWEKVMPGMYNVCILTFMSALACISMYQTTRKRKYKQTALRFAAKIRKWSKKGNPNVLHHESLLDAEIEALQGRHHVARKHYEVAILLAGRRGLINDQAVAQERFGDYHLRNGNKSDAEYHLKEALKLFEEWGAKAKVGHLQSTYSEFFSPPSEIGIVSSH